MAYLGAPVFLEDFIAKPCQSLIAPQVIFAKAEDRRAGAPCYCAWGCFSDFESG
ncbi:hypothetical protein [Bradyrhizobium agreste]|uniref:hypothetical protein n=1 Tax=Bradyrhizobium agreste TaxID=2751811 RepID=UPI001FE51B8A|nr:hypothetical protein [Bradyrhizobium agreste]